MEEYGDGYRFKLPIFEGPLDLLLYLIKKDEIDINDIPIERITKQYMEYMNLMKELNLDMAGEFVLMAAQLLYIKSRMLLPQERIDEEEMAEIVDPRSDLVRQLLEYKKFKEVAQQLHDRQIEYEGTFSREGELSEGENDGVEAGLINLTVFDLVNAFSEVLRNLPAEKALLEIYDDHFTVSGKIEAIREVVKSGREIGFLELFKNVTSRTEVVVTFIALLELIRLKEIRVTQDKPFEELRICVEDIVHSS